MSAIAPITINDGAATPLAHTFNPFQSSPDARYREASTGVALIGQGQLWITVKGDAKSQLNKVTLTLDLPALETATAQNASGYTAGPKVAYDNKVVATFFLPSRGTMQQRKDLRVLFMNALANAQIVDSIDNLALPY